MPENYRASTNPSLPPLSKDTTKVDAEPILKHLLLRIKAAKHTRSDERQFVQYCKRTFLPYIKKRVFAFINRYGTVFEPSDIFQDFLQRVFQGCSTFKEEAQAKPWLMRICANTVTDTLRVHQRFDKQTEAGRSALQSKEEQLPNHIKQMFFHDMANALLAGTQSTKESNALTPRQVGIFFAWLEGISFQHLAHQYGCARSTIYDDFNVVMNWCQQWGN